MSTDDKFENAKDDLAGKAKEGLGKLTGDKETETEGKVDQAKAGLKDRAQDAKDAVSGALNSLKNDKQ